MAAMLNAGAESQRRRLERSMEQLACVPPGQPSDGISVFDEFRRAVIQASSSKGVSPSELLGALEPKELVLRFLVELHEQKRMYRKQVAAVFVVLLQDDSWHRALSEDEELCASLPPSLRALFEEATAIKTPPNSARPSPPEAGEDKLDECGAAGAELEVETPSVTGPAVNSVDVRSYIASVLPVAKPSKVQSQSSLEASSERLEQARGQIAALGFSAVAGDEAITAFEAFRRVVLHIMRSEGSRERAFLEAVEPKDQILEFLVDFNERQKKFRSRVVATLIRLLTSDSWHAAAQKDPSVRAAIQDLVDDSDAPQTGAKTSEGSYVNWQSAAAAAIARGGIGALYIKVVAGYDLIAGDSNGLSDPYVRVTLGRTTKRTEVITDTLNPHWNTAPFIFEVPSEDSAVLFEVFDSDFFNSVPLGKVSLNIKDLPIQSSPSGMRCRLAEVPRGELEFEVLLLNGKPAATVEPPASTPEASQGTLSTPWGPVARPPYAGISPSSSSVPRPAAPAGYVATGTGNPWGVKAPATAGAPSSAPRSPWGPAQSAATVPVQRHPGGTGGGAPLGAPPLRGASPADWLAGPAAPAPACETVAPEKLAPTNPFRPQLDATK